jgi:hypothetical protein
MDRHARRAGARAGYDYAALAAILRPRLEEDGRGWRACADEIGVTAADLSRVCARQSICAGKVVAICDWLGVSFRAFYLPPDHPDRRREARQMFHGKSTETEGRADA